MALATKTSRLVSKSSNKYALKIDTLLLLADCGPDHPAPRKVLEIRALIRRDESATAPSCVWNEKELKNNYTLSKQHPAIN